jgi:lysophospholipase L1-like esterase
VANGDNSVAFLDGETFFGEALRDRCTPDNIHPTDLGFERMAMAVLPVLKKFLE